MTELEIRLKEEERIVQSLRALYLSYGYSSYKMSRFEEYDLYAGNKDFLVSSNVITFTDTDGRLMALKPDVTLSIVKGFRAQNQSVSRVCYDENVYRVSAKSGTFREIMQVGIECLGDLGIVELSEVAILAQESLKRISDQVVLTISHMGIVEGFLDALSDQDIKARALEYMQTRNLSALDSLCAEYPGDSESIAKLKSLLSLMGSNDQILENLVLLGADQDCIDELKSVVSVLDAACTRIDFSVLGGMNYYNGITFRGYVNGVPGSVVSGGQYDKLMARMGKKAKAIGFAVYMDSLERLSEPSDSYDADVALVYDASCPLSEVLAKANALRSQGKSVATMKSVSDKFRCREIISMKGGQDA